MKTQSKILSLPSLMSKVRQLRRGRRKIVFTNGCFDILHYGHIDYLQKAKQDNHRILVIGLNSDRSVKIIKGPKRPIIPQSERAAILAAMACVDFVVVFNEPTPIKVIKSLKPDVLVKGADWKGKSVTGSDVVRSYGGKVEYKKYVQGNSTTGIIKKILKKCHH